MAGAPAGSISAPLPNYPVIESPSVTKPRRSSTASGQFNSTTLSGEKCNTGGVACTGTRETAKPEAWVRRLERVLWGSNPPVIV